MPGGCSNIIVRAKALADVGGFDTALHILADWELWLRLSGHGKPACVSRPLVGYRIHPGNISLDARGMLAELREVERRYGRVDRARIVRHLAREHLRRGHRREAYSLFVRSALAGGRRELFIDVPHDVTLIAAGLWPGVRRRLRVTRLSSDHPASRGIGIARSEPAVEGRCGGVAIGPDRGGVVSTGDQRVHPSLSLRSPLHVVVAMARRTRSDGSSSWSLT